MDNAWKPSVRFISGSATSLSLNTDSGGFCVRPRPRVSQHQSDGMGSGGLNRTERGTKTMTV
jgi:hypothetical protein